MAGVLAGEGRPLLGHGLLDDRVADPGPYGPSAVLGDHLGYRPGADQVVEHRGPWLALEHPTGHQGGGRRSGDRAGSLVNQEYPVGIAVKGQTHIGAHVQHPGLQVAEVLRLDRIGRMVGERAVQLWVQQVQLEGQACEDGGHDQAAHTVSRVSYHPEGPQGLHVDEGPDVVGKGGQQVQAGGRATTRALVEPAGHIGGHLGQPRVIADRAGTGQAELHAVVAGRVVAGRQHGRRGVEVSGGEVHQVGGGQSQVDYVKALGDQTPGEGGGQRHSAGSHIAS